MTKDTFRRMMDRMEETFRDFEKTFQDFEQDFDSQFGNQIRGRLSGFPIDVEETETDVIVKADLPGIERDQIDVNVAENTLQIRAQDDREVHEEGKDYVRQERRSQNYQRSVQLPAPVAPDTAEATYNNGVLTITLTKTTTSHGTDVDVK